MLANGKVQLYDEFGLAGEFNVHYRPSHPVVLKRDVVGRTCKQCSIDIRADFLGNQQRSQVGVRANAMAFDG